MINMNRNGYWLLCFPILMLFFSCGQNPVDPNGFTAQGAGCGNFFLYAFNADKTDALVVRAEGEELEITRAPLELMLPDDRLRVLIERFDGPARSYYCDDVIEANEPEVTEEWETISGTAIITSGDTLQTDPGGMTLYNISVSLRDLTLRNKDGEEITIDQFNFVDVGIGWLPG